MAKASGSVKRKEKDERKKGRAMRRAKGNQKSDERLLGDGDFISEAFSVS
jgi:hypothetical protein